MKVWKWLWPKEKILKEKYEKTVEGCGGAYDPWKEVYNEKEGYWYKVNQETGEHYKMAKLF